MSKIQKFVNITKIRIIVLIVYLSLFCVGCDLRLNAIRETQDGVVLPRHTNLTIVLQSNLSSNTSVRGDLFSAQLKKPLKLNNKIILPTDTKVVGLVKRSTKYEKFGDRAGLALLFDQLILQDDRRIPIVASLDTENAKNVIKIKGKGVQDATVVGGSALVGALIGSSADKNNEQDLAKKGMIIGATMGTGAILLSDMKEVKLPEGTEIIIKLEEPLLIPTR